MSFPAYPDDERHTLMVDSRDRDYAKYPSPSAYRVDLPKTYRQVRSVTLQTCEIPCTFFVFSQALGNVTMDVSLLDGGGAVTVTRTVTLPDGNYSTGTITTAMSSALDTAFAGDGVTFVVQIDTATLKFSIESTTAIRIDTTSAAILARPPTGWGLAYHLGFDKNAVMSGTSVVCPRVVSLNPYTYIVMEVDGLNRLDEMSIDDPGNGRTAFAKIPISSNSWEMLMLDGSDIVSSSLAFSPPLASVDRLYIRFRFHDGKPIDFHGAEHSLTLRFVCGTPVGG
jgi:phage baseplate assembly protein gpV